MAKRGIWKKDDITNLPIKIAIGVDDIQENVISPNMTSPTLNTYDDYDAFLAVEAAGELLDGMYSIIGNNPFDGTTTAIEDRVAALESQVSSLNSTIASLQGRLADLEALINSGTDNQIFKTVGTTPQWVDPNYVVMEVSP